MIEFIAALVGDLARKGNKLPPCNLLLYLFFGPLFWIKNPDEPQFMDEEDEEKFNKLVELAKIWILKCGKFLMFGGRNEARKKFNIWLVDNANRDDRKFFNRTIRKFKN